jgi:hypothetical protein
MTDELPEIFDQLAVPPAPPELRERVLSAVNRELTRRRKPLWERAFELSVAASLALGIGLNAWQWRASATQPRRGYASFAQSAGLERSGGHFAASDAHVDQVIRDRLALLAATREPQAPISQEYERLVKELAGLGSG